MSCAIILTLALAANAGGMMLIHFLANLRWRYRGHNIKGRVRAQLDAKWLRCPSTWICRDCHRLHECTLECEAIVKSEIDAEIQEGEK